MESASRPMLPIHGKLHRLLMFLLDVGACRHWIVAHFRWLYCAEVDSSMNQRASVVDQYYARMCHWHGVHATNCLCSYDAFALFSHSTSSKPLRVDRRDRCVDCDASHYPQCVCTSDRYLYVNFA